MFGILKFEKNETLVNKKMEKGKWEEDRGFCELVDLAETWFLFLFELSEAENIDGAHRVLVLGL